jgi:hypothetical protein
MRWLEVRRHSLTKKDPDRGRGSHLSAEGSRSTITSSGAGRAPTSSTPTCSPAAVAWPRSPRPTAARGRASSRPCPTVPPPWSWPTAAGSSRAWSPACRAPTTVRGARRSPTATAPASPRRGLAVAPLAGGQKLPQGSAADVDDVAAAGVGEVHGDQAGLGAGALQGLGRAAVVLEPRDAGPPDLCRVEQQRVQAEQLVLVRGVHHDQVEGGRSEGAVQRVDELGGQPAGVVAHDHDPGPVRGGWLRHAPASPRPRRA